MFCLDLFSFIDYNRYMKSFYEKWREDQNEFSVLDKGNNLFPPHFHENVEIFVSIKGGYKITVNDKPFTVSSGEVLFIDSYDVHAYDEKLSNDELNYVFIIPSKYLGKFRALKGAKSIDCPLIKDAALCNELVQLYKDFIKMGDETIRCAAIDLALTLIISRLTLSAKKEKDESSLIKRLLVYAQENFKKDASIADFSFKTGYSKEHLSRIFHRFFKIGFPEYVNTLRFNYVQSELALNGNKKITSLLFEAGFKSVQSYYRFKSISAKSSAMRHNY